MVSMRQMLFSLSTPTYSITRVERPRWVTHQETFLVRFLKWADVTPEYIELVKDELQDQRPKEKGVVRKYMNFRRWQWEVLNVEPPVEGTARQAHRFLGKMAQLKRKASATPRLIKPSPGSQRAKELS
ncbi:hypothetical protein E5676_scaffold1121G00410 [Cucumis melo var. makuwa]|uniref:Uncharacterized protein n=1 Tax=Cucumis melo var. makuwa TaxID=1194695 RepID=A0A5A7TJU4_CUCMM|nr:hypothetical protein E6C27_scaffold824G00110 [Cucumis melo var. makuwa]TYK14252.1 hypothetical protein E5676_scaffold1121G00410 [Cucumis melo var. makuwa]